MKSCALVLKFLVIHNCPTYNWKGTWNDTVRFLKANKNCCEIYSFDINFAFSLQITEATKDECVLFLQNITLLLKEQIEQNAYLSLLSKTRSSHCFYLEQKLQGSKKFRFRRQQNSNTFSCFQQTFGTLNRDQVIFDTPC